MPQRLLAGLLCLLCFAPTAARSQSASLSLQFLPDPPANEITEGDTTSMLIRVNDPGVSIRAFTVFLTYDPGVAAVGNIEPGEVLTDPGCPHFFLSEVAPGTVEDTLKIDGGVTCAAFGPGSLAIARLIGIGVGVSPMDFIHWDLCTEEGDSCVSIPTVAQDDTLYVNYPTLTGDWSLGELKARYRKASPED
jgi:hypothetical protein